jgi:hypothetical protein
MHINGKAALNDLGELFRAMICLFRKVIDEGQYLACEFV